MRLHTLSVALGAALAAVLVLLVGFRVVPQEGDDDALVQTLQKLAEAQERQAVALERQAVAWELAAQRELPAPLVRSAPPRALASSQGNHTGRFIIRAPLRPSSALSVLRGLEDHTDGGAEADLHGLTLGGRGESLVRRHLAAGQDE